MSLLYSKRCAVVVDGLLVDGLRAQFKVEKTLTKNPNTAHITISNLSEETRRKMRNRHASVILSAGYADTVAQIFSGTARTVDHVRKESTWETVIQCGDGEVQFRVSRVSQSFGPGTKVADVIAAIAHSTGLKVGNAVDQAELGGFRGGLEQFAQGYVAHGKSSAQLDKILRSAGFDWSIQDGALQFLRPSEAAKNQAVLLSEDTGLIGSPEHGTPDKKGKPSVLKAKSLLQPTLRPGVRVEIHSRAIHGSQFRVEKVTHSGDTGATEWYSEIECLPL